MGRNHVHFSTGLPEGAVPLAATVTPAGNSIENAGEPTASGEAASSPPQPKGRATQVISGMRNDAEILIYIDLPASLASGTLWWLSDNGVVLTEGDPESGLIATKFWKKVEGRRQDVGVLWLDGDEVGELPQSVKGRKAPSGKGPGGKGRSAGRGGKGKGSGGGRMRELEALGGEQNLGIDT